VFGCPADSTANDVIAAAIYRAAEDGADIITISIGGGPSYNDEVDTIAAATVGAAGHIVLGANGNDGSSGYFTNGNPGGSSGGFGVASVDNLAAPA
jgi:minor extracellular serine protease Vpr